MVRVYMEDKKLEEIRGVLDSALVLENEKLVKIIIAIDSSENKKLLDEEIQELTGLSSKTIYESINLLDKTNYISAILQDIPGRSLHKVCQLTEKGRQVLKLIED